MPWVTRWTNESPLWLVFVYLGIVTSDPGPPRACVCEGMSPELMSPNPACMPAKDATCNYADGWQLKQPSGLLQADKSHAALPASNAVNQMLLCLPAMQ